MCNRIAVFGGGDWKENSSEWDLGVDVGGLLAENNILAVTGGYSGAMEAVCKGAFQSQGKTFAYLHINPEISPPNQYVQQYEMTSDYLDRLACLLRIPTAIGLPGSSGTFAEVAISIAMLNRHPGRKLALYKPFWQSFTTNNIGDTDKSMWNNAAIFWFQHIDDLEGWINSIKVTDENYG
ncbi:MAG: hypothetical protein P9L92_12860 [Candidatus Electryonea clarkiae]|nr:hypothetical protein [Candidatus Electryonea clarkiae]MDP8288734.1 hypothetical protein [Candidatus Electryonea clarkiae]